MDKEKALKLHQEWAGKIEVTARCPVNSAQDLTYAYTPGVAEPCLAIAADKSLSYAYTRRHNMVAVVSDGTAVLGLGDIGPEAAMPVMEGKCVLFKSFADVDAFPICLATKDVDEIVRTIALMAPSFGGINLEDIAAPRCFEIEKKLKQICDIPIFHDDQHGTAVVVVAALINALKLVKKQKQDIKIAISGAGAAAQAVARLLLKYGVGEISLYDIDGVVYQGRPNMDSALIDIAKITNPRKIKGDLVKIIKDADVFVGLSAPNLVNSAMISTMAEKAIVFAMANPVPEIYPDEALKGGAAIVGSGRSDFANQINNVLAFPGIFRGTFDANAYDINEEMKLAAAYAIADFIPADELNPQYIIPPAFAEGLAQAVALKVAQAAKDSGVIRK